MNTYDWEEILSYSIAIPAIIGLVRFKKIDSDYLPFVYLMWVGLLSEIVASISINYYNSNVIQSNVYCIAESLLILWFFYKRDLFGGNRSIPFIIIVLYLVGWIMEISFYSINRISTYFNVLYSFVTVLLSIQMINKLMIFEKGRLLRNSTFLISIGFISFFTIGIIVEIFWFYGMIAKPNIALVIYHITVYTNLAVNILFIFAVLWIPRKLNYIQPF